MIFCLLLYYTFEYVKEVRIEFKLNFFEFKNEFNLNTYIRNDDFWISDVFKTSYFYGYVYNFAKHMICIYIIRGWLETILIVFIPFMIFCSLLQRTLDYVKKSYEYIRIKFIWA